MDGFSLHDDPKSSTSLLMHFGIFASVFAVGVIFYDILRVIAPGHCYYRSKAAHYRSDDSYDGRPLQSPPRPKKYPLAWVWPTWITRSMILLSHMGWTLRCTFASCNRKFGRSLFFLCSPPWRWFLCTSHRTSRSLTRTLALPIWNSSLANIPDRSARLWGTLLAEVVVTTVVLVFLYRDVQEYTRQRILYRRQSANNPSNFAVLVMDISKKDRCESRVFNFFNTVCPGQIAAVNIMVRDAGKLLAMKTNLIFLLNRQRFFERQHGSDDDDESDLEAPEQETISVAPLALS